MKRSERHRLKQNELATSVLQAREQFLEHRRGVSIGIVALIVVAVAAGGYFIWRQRNTSRAAELLARAMVVLEAQVVPPTEGSTATPEPGTYPSERAKLEAALPRLIEAAESHPPTPPALAARYHAAATLAQLGRLDEAQRRYQEVIDLGGNTVYAEMARMGLAEVHAQAGKHDEAIRRWQELSKTNNAGMPLDGVLVQLARAYALAGRTKDAENTFNRILKEFPDSQYAPIVKQELEELKAAPQKPS